MKNWSNFTRVLLRGSIGVYAWLLLGTSTTSGQHCYLSSIPEDKTRLLIARSLYETHFKANTFTFHHFIYLKNGSLSDFDRSFIMALQQELPDGTEPTVILDGTMMSDVLERYPDSQVFTMTYGPRVDASGVEHDGMSLCFSMENIAGHCSSVELNSLLCYPNDVRATITVKNLLNTHHAMREFWSSGPKEPRIDATKAHDTEVKKLQEQKIFIANTDLNFDLATRPARSPLRLEVVDKDSIYAMIKRRDDALVLLAPDDDCNTNTEIAQARDSRVLYHCATGKCIVDGFGRSAQIPGQFGFDENHILWLEERIR